MAISKHLRYEVFRRDGYRCRYCGAGPDDAKLTVDHVVPVALGGSDEPANLVTACDECNAGKSASSPETPIVENVADDALRWAAAMERAAELQANAQAERWDYTCAFDRQWSGWTYSDDSQIERPSDWRSTLEKFHDLGLEYGVISDAIDRAMNKRGIRGKLGEWRYFCGTCWGVLTDRQEMARDLIAREDADQQEPDA